MRDNYFGLDMTLPTSTIDTVVDGSVPTADGTATDPSSTSPLEHCRRDRRSGRPRVGPARQRDGHDGDQQHPEGSSFDFELWTGADCNTGADDTQVGTTENVAVGDGTPLTGTEESSDTDPLHAGFYSFRVFFNSGDTDTVADGEAACEVVEVLKADTTITTEMSSTSARATRTSTSTSPSRS